MSVVFVLPKGLAYGQMILVHVHSNAIPIAPCFLQRFAWRSSRFGVFRFEAFVWELSLWIFRLGCFDWELSRVVVRFETLSRELSRCIVRLGFFIFIHIVYSHVYMRAGGLKVSRIS
jgi:hypothetical protein